MKRITVVSLLLVLFAVAVDAQIFQMSRDQIVAYTKDNPFERSSDGRPKVPDEFLKKLQQDSAEEVWTILHKYGYDNQYAGDWHILQPKIHLVGRALTAQFMPARKDVQSVAEDKANSGLSFKHNANQRIIDMLREGDVIVADLFGKIEGGTFVGDNLATAIQTYTHTGMVINGALRDLDSIQETGMPVYIKGAHPTPINEVMLTGVNVPLRIDNATVMPGDVVFGDSEGIYFIPPQFVKEIVEHADELHVHDDWSQMMLKSGKYKTSDIYPSPHDPDLRKQYEEYKRQHLGHDDQRQR